MDHLDERMEKHGKCILISNIIGNIHIKHRCIHIWKDKVNYDEVLHRIQTRMHFKKDMKKRKLEYAGHVLRGSSGRTHIVLLEGKVCGKNLGENQDSRG